MLEDAFVLQDPHALLGLFEADAVLRTASCEARGREQLDLLASKLWDVTYLADPVAVLQVRGTALIVSDHALNVARRDSDGRWHYLMVLLDYQPRASHSPG